MMRDITSTSIVGPTRAANSYLAALYALAQAHQGQQVLYEAHDMTTAAAALQGAAVIAADLGLKMTRISRSAGRYGIEFPSGGKVSFRPPARVGLRPERSDVHILDDSRGAPSPVASQILRTVIA